MIAHREQYFLVDAQSIFDTLRLPVGVLDDLITHHKHDTLSMKVVDYPTILRHVFISNKKMKKVNFTEVIWMI